MSEAKQRPKRRPAKGPGGRPSKYDPAFCEALIEHMSGGLSVGGVAGEFGVSRATIYQWAEDHPEFSDALKIGQAKAQLFWEKALIGAHKGGAPVTGAIFALKNRGRDDWTDTARIDHTSSDRSMSPGGLSDDLVRALEKIAQSKSGGDQAG